ncbi:twin-arginine translocase TatA/TatE family subunit [Neomoorella mulderi]|uniref:Sec-independent protein translocase protein TatA n=1 Tax=Moorella mulderi DSM 14980 TaxID=1122241 RepID=A0A151AY31_9FIRM|nr:twin-arginine translocase TatA/TatE family subunit [Moorella mulderi]KYH32558.1 Sec-independent protein translocase protein TatAy [Moorella mulderi DSM 14980]
MNKGAATIITLGTLFSPYAWVLIILAAIVIFGPKRLPEIGRGLGRTIKEFKKGLDASDKPEKK